MKKHDSLLYLLTKWGVCEQFPNLQSHLLLEDVRVPDLPCIIKLAEMLRKDEEEINREKRENKGKSAIEDERSVAAKLRCAEEEHQQPPATGFLNRYLRAQALKQIPTYVPAVVREHYHGLNALESGAAYMQYAVGAVLADDHHHPALRDRVRRLSRKAGVACPRVIVMESDFPDAAGFIFPHHPPAMMISEFLLKNLNDRQLDATIVHELRHIKERSGRGWVMSALRSAYTDWMAMEPNIQEEFRADKFAVDVTGDPDAMVEALVIATERFYALKKFGKELQGALQQYHVANSALPAPFGALTMLAHVPMRVFPEKTPEAHRRANRIDPHPPTIERFDALSRNAEPSGLG